MPSGSGRDYRAAMAAPMTPRTPLALTLLALVTGGLGCAGGGATAPPPSSDPGAEPPGRMVRIPGGRFRTTELTGPREDLVTYESVRSFLIDATEVTVAEYTACVKAGKCRPASATVQWDLFDRGDRKASSALCNRDREDRADHPVNCVDWNDARAYCAFVGKRLPSEQELEWTARRGDRATSYPWGDEAPGSRACWSGEGNDAGGKRVGTCPVGSHPEGEGPPGVKDLAGNVWEWTSSETIYGAASRGGGNPVRVARGGGWADSNPWRLSAASRFADKPTRRSSDLGFRCARRD
jgi:formylglycine-generating enzyme required for sulfatase activity